MIRRVALLSTVLLLLTSGSASAATVTVTVTNKAFTGHARPPNRQRRALGKHVRQKHT